MTTPGNGSSLPYFHLRSFATSASFAVALGFGSSLCSSVVLIPNFSVFCANFLLFSIRYFSVTSTFLCGLYGEILVLVPLRVSLCPLWFKKLLSAFISENQRQKGSDFLRASAVLISNFVVFCTNFSWFPSTLSLRPLRSFASSAVSFGLVLLRVSSVPQCLRGGFCFLRF